MESNVLPVRLSIFTPEDEGTGDVKSKRRGYERVE